MAKLAAYTLEGQSLRLFLSFLLGIAVVIALLLNFDLGAVMAAVKHGGISGFLLIVGAGLAVEVVLAIGIWPLLLSPVPLPIIVAARQLRDSSSDVLPITQIGGVAFAARALVLYGMAASEASAVVIADFTTEAFAQGLYVFAGVLASLSLLYASPALSPYVTAMLGGALFISFGSIGFALVQLGGGKWVDRMADKLFGSDLTRARTFHEIIHAIYGRHKRVALSILLQLAGWFASGFWLWVILRTMGFHADIRAALAIQALLEGLRSATVFIPASVGIQEAGYAVLAPVFGFTPEIGLAVSLLRRARDLVVAMPVLLIWQLIEGRRAYRA